MEKSFLFQYAIIWNPTKKEAEDGKKSVLIGEIKTVLAKSQQEVNVLASRSIPEGYLNCLDQIDIAVSPF
jgi:hypothetical protein